MGRERDTKIKDVTLEIERDTKTTEEISKFAEFSRRWEGGEGLLKILLLVLALCGFGLSIAGVLQRRKDHCESAWLFDHEFQICGFQWWALGFEAFVLMCVGLEDVADVAKDVCGMLTGLLLFACMQIDQAGWYTWLDANQRSQARNLMGAGFALLYGVNIYVAVCLGFARFSRYRGESKVVVWNGVWLRVVGFVVAGVGISGVGMVAKVVADTCEVTCESRWWPLAQHSFALLLFISTQVVTKMEAFKPVLTVLLATRIRSWVLDLGNTDDSLAKVGLVLTIVSAYLLILMCMESRMKDDIVEGGGFCRVSILFFIILFTLASPFILLACLVSVLMSAEEHSHVVAWIFASGYLALVFWYVWLLTPLKSLQLPVVAFLALAIYDSPLWIHAWLTKGQGLAFEGIANLILTIVFLFIMMRMGTRKKVNN